MNSSKNGRKTSVFKKFSRIRVKRVFSTCTGHMKELHFKAVSYAKYIPKYFEDEKCNIYHYISGLCVLNPYYFHYIIWSDHIFKLNSESISNEKWKKAISDSLEKCKVTIFIVFSIKLIYQISIIGLWNGFSVCPKPSAKSVNLCFKIFENKMLYKLLFDIKSCKINCICLKRIE